MFQMRTEKRNKNKKMNFYSAIDTRNEKNVNAKEKNKIQNQFYMFVCDDG